jgi:ASC-1-like (ASCH) protein
MQKFNVLIKTIPHKNQRYETVGDWVISKGGKITIKVSDMNNYNYCALVAIHELIETLLCKNRGVKEVDVSRFDKQFEKDRAKGLHSLTEEPGDSPLAPYRLEHRFSTKLEKILCAELGLEWDKYSDTVENL